MLMRLEKTDTPLLTGELTASLRPRDSPRSTLVHPAEAPPSGSPQPGRREDGPSDRGRNLRYPPGVSASSPRGLQRGSRELRHGSRELQHGSRGFRVATHESLVASRGTFVANHETRVSTHGTCVAIHGTCVAIRGTRVAIRETRITTQGSCVSTRGICVAIQGPGVSWVASRDDRGSAIRSISNRNLFSRSAGRDAGGPREGQRTALVVVVKPPGRSP